MLDYRTVTIPERGEDVLLGRKKRKIGAGFFNGFGGKMESSDKTIADTSIRETWEETGGKQGTGGIEIIVQEEIGVMTFRFTHNDDQHEVHFYRATEFRGQPQETDEMAPQWFKKTNLPLNQMFPGDKLWVPLYLQGQHFNGWVLYDEKFAIVDHKIEET